MSKDVTVIVLVIAALSTSAIAADLENQPNPKLVVLTEPVQTEYGVFGRGRQMTIVAREGEYVRVQYLAHEVLIPVSSTDLPDAKDSIHPDAEVQRRSIIEAIREHRVVIGMTAEQCRMAWGNPLRVSRNLNVTGNTEQWVYSSSRDVSIENGRVTSIQTSPLNAKSALTGRTQQSGDITAADIMAGFSNRNVRVDDFLPIVLENVQLETHSRNVRWPTQFNRVSRGPDVQKISDSEWRVNFEIYFDVRNPAELKRVNGTANLTWTLRKRESGGVEIASAKEQVTSRTYHDVQRVNR